MSGRITRLEDLAALAGVSTATASRALADSGAVGAATKKRVLQLARAHGYRGPRADADADAGPTIILAAAPDDATARAFAEALIAAAGAAQIISRPAIDADEAARLVRASRSGGAIFVGDAGLHDAFNRLVDDGERFAVWGPKRPDQAYCCIGASDTLAGRRAMLHLARMGRRRIAYIGDTRAEAGMQHYRGWLDAHDSAGLAPDPSLVMAEAAGFDGGRAGVGALAARGATVDAVVAADDLIALGALRALAAAGRTVGDAVALIGNGDLAAGRMATPALSSVACDVAGAAARLIAALATNGPLRAERLAADIVIRESCGGADQAGLSGAA